MRMTLRRPASRTRRPRRARGLENFRRTRRKLHRHHRAQPANVDDLRVARLQRTQRGLDARANRAGSLEKLLVHDLEDLQRRRAGDRISGKGAAQAARLGRVHDLGLSDDRGERKPSAQRLRDRHQVGLDAVVLAREEPAGAPETRLNLVGDENDSVLGGNASQLVQKVGRGRDEAAFAEHRFDDDRRHAVGGHHAVKDFARALAVHLRW